MSPARHARGLVAVLYRHAGLIALCTLAGGAASLAWTLHEPRLYVVTAKIALRAQPPAAGGIETEMALLRAGGNAQAVVEKYAIRDDQLARAGEPWLRTEPAAARAGRARTVDLFLDGLSAGRWRANDAGLGPDVLEVKFECADPLLAPVALQSLLDGYLQLGAQHDHRLAETREALLTTLVAQASEDARRTEDDVVALLVREGLRNAGRGLRLDLDAPVRDASREGEPGPSFVAAGLHTAPLPLRLDPARRHAVEDAGTLRNAGLEPAGPQRRPDGAVRGNMAFEAELDRLDRARQLAQARLAGLQLQFDRIDLSRPLNPADAEPRVIFEPPGRRAVSEVGNRRLVALLGPTGGLLLGLLLAGLRELGGGRMRSPREAERALGVPVLGAIPTLSAKARDAYLGALPPTSAQPA